MSRRSLTLLIASAGVIAALALAVLIPVPYVILQPGPTLNTLGKDSSGQPLITITGHATYPTTGNLNMVTVGYQGGPGNSINIFSALAAWLNPHEPVISWVSCCWVCCWVWPGANSSDSGTTASCGFSQAASAEKMLMLSPGPPW